MQIEPEAPSGASFLSGLAVLGFLTAILLVLAILIGHVRAEPATTRTLKDSMGREVGRAETQGNVTTFRDSMGRETGRAVQSGSGTTFYDNLGRETGRAKRGSSGR